MASNRSAVLASSSTGIICGVHIRRSGGEHRTRLILANRRLRRHWPPDTMPRRCREFVDSRLRRSPPDRASAVPYGQAGENAMPFPRLAHRSAAAHKLHSTPQQHRMNLISGSSETSSRLPIFSLFLPGSCPNNRDRRRSNSAPASVGSSSIADNPVFLPDRAAPATYESGGRTGRHAKHTSPGCAAPSSAPACPRSCVAEGGSSKAPVRGGIGCTCSHPRLSQTEPLRDPNTQPSSGTMPLLAVLSLMRLPTAKRFSPITGYATLQCRSPMETSPASPIEMSRSTVCLRLVEVAWDDGDHDEPQRADAPAGADRYR